MLLLDRFSHWIFDLDGTLTKPIHDFPWIRQQLDIPAGEDILGYIAAQLPERQQKMNLRLAEIEEMFSQRAEANPQAGEFLARLQERGCEMGILTRNQRHCVDLSLGVLGFSDYFKPEAIVASETTAPKPNPDGIHHLLDLWRAPADQTLIIGDYLFDLQAGKAAGIATIHYAPAGQPLWPQYTDLRVESFQQLLALLSD